MRLRQKHGYPSPHAVKYWGIGNEVDGPWQIGYKTPQEYARSFTEFGKVMKWVDPGIKLLASATSSWAGDFFERGQLLLEQASDLIDYMSIHWYVGNRENDFPAYMALSELIEERLAAYEGLIRAVSLARQIKRHIAIAVDEWNVWYRAGQAEQLEEVYNLEDALLTAIQMNAFIRHAAAVRMANLAQVVNVIAPVLTRPDGLVLQTIFYPFELYSRSCGDRALDVFWEGETFSGGSYSGVRLLDVAASLSSQAQQLSLFVVNRSADLAVEAELSLSAGSFGSTAKAWVVNGKDIKSTNTFDAPGEVKTREFSLTPKNPSWVCTFEPHSVTCIMVDLK